jgi:hypothetical protein
MDRIGTPLCIRDFVKKVNSLTDNHIIGYVGGFRKKNIRFDARVEGCTSSGNAALTTLGNTLNVLLYWKLILRRALLREIDYN